MLKAVRYIYKNEEPKVKDVSPEQRFTVLKTVQCEVLHMQQHYEADEMLTALTLLVLETAGPLTRGDIITAWEDQVMGIIKED